MYFTQGDCYHYGPVYIGIVEDLNSGVTSQEDEFEIKNAAIVRKENNRTVNFGNPATFLRRYRNYRDLKSNNARMFIRAKLDNIFKLILNTIIQSSVKLRLFKNVKYNEGT
ncbi:hypothetical protein [Priestia megaterium]|uniref:hypothetical protein n=1 Tax=Priestia megaterium TaxID=1404 RepID=UPI0024489ABF|nr:hypothetical protein [Priestia megaterium]MDH2363324.1 hypothetical protein [Priestia megaterium]